MFNFLSPQTAVLRPTIVRGHYPERHDPSPGLLDQTAKTLTGMAAWPSSIQHRCFKQIAGSIRHQGRLLEKHDAAAMEEQIRDLRRQLIRNSLSKKNIIEAFALIREMAWRTLGMRHYDTQMMGGWIMINGGLAEMETGEGKTLTATLAAATAGLAGIPVHVITVNDYLVNRDAELMAPLYQALGLSVGTVTSDMDGPARREAYGCNITYCTNKQIAFDYLRDRILIGNDQGRLCLELERLDNTENRLNQLFLRGLCFAIVDEADSVLIDEARTPLIISRQHDNPEEKEIYQQATALAAQLQDGVHFTVDLRERRVEISDRGSDKLTELTTGMDKIWTGIRRREELARQALTARYLYRRDHHYLVSDGKVVIIDENTGRPMPDRSWERGLHQMIELKENCEMTGQKEHLARITYQRFFRRYLRLSGMTGTAREVRGELWSVYNLRVNQVPTYKPCRRRNCGTQIYPDKTGKWTAVIKRIREIRQTKRPVLVGTCSVADSELLSARLLRENLPHQLLNARQDAGEAEIITRAGERSRITIATNMAGRGTDIPLGEGVRELGGLHIIQTEMNEARRIDRQLFGRCGRQGDPGSYEAILSLEDGILANSRKKAIFGKRVAQKISANKLPSQKLSQARMTRSQQAIERRHLRIRRDLFQVDEQLGQLLAFSGRME